MESDKKSRDTQRVKKRGSRGFEKVRFDKIVSRIEYLCDGLHSSIDPTKVAMQTIQNLYDGIPTEELDRISAKIAESFKMIHPDYGILAGRICISNLHKTTPDKFSECMKILKENTRKSSKPHNTFIEKHAQELDNMIIHQNDYNIDYLGYKTLENSYLHKIGDRICDRPQYMFMRVAIAIYMNFDIDVKVCLEQIKICYKGLSQMYFIHATPTLFNACTHNQQLMSCFLLGTGDSIEEIMRTVTNASLISKWAGGESIWFHCIRCRNSMIHGTNGKSSGLPKQLKIYNEAARCWDQGGKRLGAIAAYLEPWQGDILDFLQLKLNNGAETERARDLFYALWIPDLFIKRALENGDWSLFSEDTAQRLSDVYDGMPVCKKCHGIINFNDFGYLNGKIILSDPNEGDMCFGLTCEHEYEFRDVFTDLYTQYEKEGKAIRVIKAREILEAIFVSQRESGTPYICFKDHVNRKSNQKNVGTIKSSNLCTEIMEWSSKDSYACCCLASINVKKFLNNGSFDHSKLHEVVKLVARNLDIIIDINKYPVIECEGNSLSHRPIGIGIQGLADLFHMLRLPYLSLEAETLDLEIMETIYHAALEASMEIAKLKGRHEYFEGSPASEGLLQFDLWTQDIEKRKVDLGRQYTLLSGRYDWDKLKAQIKEFGLSNSLCVALMPTVSTSQILGNGAESFEPYSSGVLNKTTLAGKFSIIDNLMVRHLLDLNLWNEDLKNKIIANDGSLQGIKEIPLEIQELYKTVWELPQKELMRRAALRGAFVDQSQSLNIYVKDSQNKILRSILLEGHRLGLKTGSYYIRTLPGASVLKNNLSVTNRDGDSNEKSMFCTKDCIECSS